jgi:transcriptional regulator with XRE-family HTH domain
MSIKSSQTKCFTDIFYRSLFSLLGKHDILSTVINMDIDKKLIGKRIRHQREIAGLSQEQLAEKLELSTNHISSMECGKSLLTTKRLLDLCDILGGTPNYYLLGEIGPEADHITTLIRKLSPDAQSMLCRLLETYLYG